MDEPQKNYSQKEARYKGPPTVWFQLYEISRKGKSIETENRLVVADLARVGVKR